MSYKLLAIVALLAAVALAQPYANGPVLTRYNYVQPASSMSRTAVTEVVLGRGWAFTATSDGVYGMNASQPAYDSSTVQFFDALTGVTQLFATGPSTILAIANSTLMLYEYNETTAWRAAWYKSDYLVFDVQQANTGSGMSYLGPMNAEGLLVLGSKNLRSATSSWSMVFAFNMTTLDLVWNTTIAWDTTSFAPASYYGDQFVFIQAQNTYAASSNVRVLKLWANNGTIVGSALNTGTSYFTVIGVTNTQLLVASRYYIDIYDIATWTKLRSTVSTDYASYMLYQPIAINNTWYAMMDDSLYAFDYTTSAQLSWSPKQFTRSVQGGAMRFFNESMSTGVFESNLLLMEGCRVWVVNATGVVQLMEFPLAQGATQCNPQGAVFDWDWSGRFGMIDNIAHLSYTSSYGGTVIAINYATGMVLGQATGNFNPVGRAKLDLWHGRVYSASTSGGIIQGFAFPPRRTNYSDFVAAIPSSESQTTNFGFAYNATNMSSYYITEDNLYTVDSMGNVAKVAAIPNTAYYVYNNPLIVGQYFVFTAYYGGSYYLYSYNSVAKTITGVSICSVSTTYAMFSVGTVVYGNCDSSSRAAISVDVSKSTLTVTSFGTYYGEGLSADSKHVAFVSLDVLYIYDITGTTPTQKFKSPSTWALNSAPVLYGDNLFIAGYAYTLGVGVDTSMQLLKVSVPGGSVTKMGSLYSSTYSLFVMQNGAFGSAGYVYCVGTNNVTAFNMGSNEKVFSYGVNTSKYGSIVSRALSPVVLSNGAIAFYTSNSYLQVVGGFEGGLAWSFAGATSTIFPITTDGRSIYFANNNQIVGADTYTGAVTSVTSFGSQTLYGYALAPGVNETTVVGANGLVVFAATTPLYESPAGPNPSFPGQGGNNNGGGGLLEEAKSKAWIAGVVIGVLVVIVVVVIIAKKKSEAQTFDDDYVPMNPSTQV